MTNFHPTDVEKQLERSSVHASHTQQFNHLTASYQNVQAQPLHRLYSTEQDNDSQTTFHRQKPNNPNLPLWIRPFRSLRIQLTSLYATMLALIVLLLYGLFAQGLALSSLLFLALILIVLGTVIAFLLTSFLLSPLQHITDAAQAIAIGDTLQRERIFTRRPPQDECDRLSNSLLEVAKRLERADELQRVSEQRFRRFFSDASHQLRTPLTSLRGFTEVLLRGLKDDPEATQRALSLMKSETERMTLLINDLLTLARLDDTHPLRLQHCNLTQLATERIEQIKRQVSDGRVITLEVITTQDLSIQADEERLKQLLYVLLDNAVKYGRPTSQGIVTLQLDRVSNTIVIRVIDNGDGITREDLEHIFDSFYRGHSQGTSSNALVIGTGLGLTIASAVVHAHHGTINVESSPQKGTTFTVTLPYKP